MTEPVFIPLAFVGLAGAAFGTALSFSSGLPATASAARHRLAGLFILTVAAVAAFISARHARLLPPGA